MITKIIENMHKNLLRFTILFVAFVVGWIIYIIGIFSMPYAGFFGILFQIIFGAIISGIIVFISYIVGFILKKYIFKNICIDNGIRIFILLLSFLLLIFGNKIGLTQQYTNPELGETFQSLNINIAIICYIAIVFFIANWPIQRFNKKIKNVYFQKIDLSFKPEPNTAVPLVEVYNTNVLLSFNSCELNDYDFKNSKIAKIEFEDCLIYRNGAPNEDGFYLFGADPKINNDSIYSKKAFPDLDFNTFYNVTGIDWKNNLLGNGTKILNDHYKEKKGFTHFVFLMKDGTFECVAKEYKIK